MATPMPTTITMTIVMVTLITNDKTVTTATKVATTKRNENNVPVTQN